MQAWDEANIASRLLAKDPTIWSEKPLPELADRLGWIDLPESMTSQVDDIIRFRNTIRDEGYSHVVVLGMGGSSLAPEVFQDTFGSAGYPELMVLDSTHPDALLTLERRIHLDKTLFIVSSKSGGTMETLSFFRYFWAQLLGKVKEPAKHFVAITDPGSSLEELARDRCFRETFLAPPEVGGRYSALSVFGLVPAALIGVDIGRLLEGSKTIVDAMKNAKASSVPAIELGAIIGELAAAGRDKLTIVTSPSLGAFPAWVEQLVAESTGKDGKGILPVVDEPIGEPDAYGEDRLFVAIYTEAEGPPSPDALEGLEKAGQPAVHIEIPNRYSLGTEFLRWEIAVAMAGAVLELHPFNQPDVQLAKDMAKKAMADKVGADKASVTTVNIIDDRLGEVIRSWVGTGSPGDYIALHAYVAPTPDVVRTLQWIRRAVGSRTKLATTMGFGPRFLHSTGQLHKGGRNNGLFLQIVDEAREALPVPEADFTFSELIRAQAQGDAEALLQRKQRVLRVTLGRGGETALETLLAAVRG
ncbi:MAG: hypothetical protein O7D32_06100 [bacterium]|nr:hypothetical protein [bacterium]